ncbi:hypothetical protein Pelo_9024 [Pelomyxa schiedti]|nr:hypothetical protein Pelo_9024 [Pelomyxa schiedti]
MPSSAKRPDVNVVYPEGSVWWSLRKGSVTLLGENILNSIFPMAVKSVLYKMITAFWVVVAAAIVGVANGEGLPEKAHIGTFPYTMKFRLYAADGYSTPVLPWIFLGEGVQYADPVQNLYRKDIYYSVPHTGFNVSVFATESAVTYSWGTPYYGIDLHFCYTGTLGWYGPIFNDLSFSLAVNEGSVWATDPENLVSWPCLQYSNVCEYYASGEEYYADSVKVLEDAASGRPFQIITCSTGENNGCLLYQIELGDPTAFVPSIADYSVFLPPDSFDSCDKGKP